MIAFAPFVLDLRSGRLTRGTAPIPLRPKTWAVLCFLAERPSVLISKDELFAELWPGTFVTDDTLAKSIRELREALGDDPRLPRFIETVRGRGFRFIARIDRATPVEGAPSLLAQPETREDAAAATFVGRDAELDQLAACARRAWRGERHIVFITGEAGMGKTALIDVFLSRCEVAARASGGAPSAGSRSSTSMRVACGYSVEQTGEREAYLPVLAAVEDLARGTEGDDVLPLLRRFAPTWLAQMPWLVAPGDAETLERSLIGIRPERMQRELCAFVEALSADRLLCLILEDLHWSDPATAELLFMLAQRREPARLLVLATYRPNEGTPQQHALVHTKQTLRYRRQCVEIPVRSLPLADVQAYIEQRFPGCVRATELARLVHGHTDGNPLFVVAVLDDLIGRGWLIDTAPGWALAVPAAKVDLRVPEDVREMIAVQFQVLDGGDQRLLEAASVVGMEFGTAIVAASTDSSEDDVESACERLSRAHRFLRVNEAADRTAYRRRFRFVHALYWQVVYDQILASRRRRLHQRAGEALEAAYGNDAAEIAAELSVHFEHGGDVERAVAYSRAAAVRAEQRHAPREAIAYLERALGMVAHLPVGRQRDRHELELRAQLGAPLGALHGYPSDAARRNCERLRDLCEPVGTLHELYAALYALWFAQAARAEPAAVSTADRLVHLAAEIGDPELRAQAQVVLGRMRFWQGEFAAARDVLHGALGFWNGGPGPMAGAVLGEPPGIAVHLYSAVALWCVGYPDAAVARTREALVIAKQVAHPFVVAGTLLQAAYLEHLGRRSAEVKTLAEQTIVLAEAHEFPFWKGMACALLGWAISQDGDAARGAALVRQGLEQHRAGGARILCPHMLAFLAGACLRLADIPAGLHAVEEGLKLSASTCDRAYVAELWRLKGELLAAQTDRGSAPAARTERRVRSSRSSVLDAAAQCMQQAIEIARSQGARSFELRAATSLARLWRQQGKVSAARAVLAAVYERFTEGFDTADLRDARTLLGLLAMSR